MIAVITQDEDAGPTIGLPFLDTFLVPQIPGRKMTQQTLVFQQKSAPAHVMTTLNGHFRDNTFVTTHMRKVKNKKRRNKKESKTNNSKKKTGTANMEHLPKLMINARIRETLCLHKVITFSLQQMRNLARGIEN
jgi:hypothetical protein